MKKVFVVVVSFSHGRRGEQKVSETCTLEVIDTTEKKAIYSAKRSVRDMFYGHVFGRIDIKILSIEDLSEYVNRKK